MVPQRLLTLVTLLILCLGFNAIQAQTKTKLSGKIIDSETGTALAGASVTLIGGGGANTDVEGRFFMTVDLGEKYSLTFSNVGYEPKTINDVQVNESDPTPLNVSLIRSGTQLQNVVVTASMRRETVASLYSVQKNSSAISDGISAEIIKRSPDRSTGEVLKRVSGASVQDNKFVVVRGLSERYNISLLNNSVLPSTEADKKAFAFDIIPSSIVDNLIIYKASSPDLPGDFSGGAIKVLTKDYPTRKISDLTVSFGYNNLTTGKNFYKGYPDNSSDNLGFLDNSRLIPGPYYRNRDGFILKDDQFKNNVTKLFPNSFGLQAANQSIPAISVNYTGGNTAMLKNGNKLGYVYSVGYSNGRAVSERLRENYNYSSAKELLYGYNTTNYDEKNNLTGLMNLTYSYGKSKISWKNLFNNSFTRTAAQRGGANYEVDLQGEPFYVKSANTEVNQNGIVNSVLEGLHKAGNDWTLDWNASIAYTYKNQPDQRILAFRSPQDDDGNYYLRLSNENSPEIRNAGRVYSFLGEYIYGASANVTKQFRLGDKTQKFKFGTMNYYRDRAVEVDALGYATLDFRGVSIPESKETSFTTLFSPENIDKYNLTVANIATNSADYKGTAMMNAGFLMLDNKISEKFKFTWGARIERYRQELSARGKANRVYENTDVLPSALLTYSLNSKTNLRLAASQAVNRPEFRELADYSVFDYENYLVIRGNPDLTRSKNTNADLRYEWYPAAGEIISASIFYKYFDKPIEQTNRGNDVLSYENADHSTAYGVELEVRKKLDFIGGRFFEQLTFYTNAAYIKGSVQFNGFTTNSPLQGQSPYLVNSGLNYTSANDGFSVNFLYNRIGPRLRYRAIGGAALDIFERPRDVLDFQISKKIFGDRLEAKLTISDILAQRFSWYYKYEANASNTNYKASMDKIINSYRLGTTSTLSLKYSFGK